jgi:hypothetical protein
VVRKRLLPFLLFDSSAASGDAGSPPLTSVFGDHASAGELPLFPEISSTDQQQLLEYLHTSEHSAPPPPGNQQIIRQDKDGNDVAWAGDDELNQWGKLRIFQSSQSIDETKDEVKAEERTVGKILIVDNKCKWCGGSK